METLEGEPQLDGHLFAPVTFCLFFEALEADFWLMNKFYFAYDGTTSVVTSNFYCWYFFLKNIRQIYQFLKELNHNQ